MLHEANVSQKKFTQSKCVQLNVTQQVVTKICKCKMRLIPTNNSLQWREFQPTDKSLEVQRSVVIEEFKQNYLNQPYGDVWLLLRPLAFKKHPYKWATIGKEVSHIENATMDDVKSFFYSHYLPNNAILSVAGDVELNQIKDLSKKWFADIPEDCEE